MKLSIRNVHARIEGKDILRGVDLELESGTIHALMGPNGSGKSTLANVIMGHPSFEIVEGSIFMDDTDITNLSTDERARMGLFLAFQYPSEIDGVTTGKFLKRVQESFSVDKKVTNVSAFINGIRQNMTFLDMDQAFINRYLNVGFSGGEKKRMEILQMLSIKPSVAILDEIDSGLDVDALKLVAKGINHLRSNTFSALIITHYRRILDHVRPDHVHVMSHGRIVRSGGAELIDIIEQQGYESIQKESFRPEAHYETANS
jgi:Fe-S cluster assembly ATP-binding protein